MSESKHTPGPWKYREPIGMGRMYHIFFYDEHNIALGRIDGYVDGVSCGKSGYPNREETIANARLIAAAPEMKEQRDALLKVSKEAFGVLTEPGVMDVDKWKGWRKLTVAKLREAIEQAEKGSE